MHSELRAEDFRALYRLLGECQELWLDPAAWQQHLLAGISAWIHLPVGMRCTVAQFEAHQRPRIETASEHGWEDGAQRAHFQRQMREGVGAFHTPLDCRFREKLSANRQMTLSRADLISSTKWQRSELFNRAYRPAGMLELISSAVRTGEDGRFDVLGFGGPDHRPTARDCQFVNLVHRELVPVSARNLIIPYTASVRADSKSSSSPSPACRRKRSPIALRCAARR